MKPYYEQDGIVLYHGDCRDILPQLAPVDHVITDPPYGINLNNDWQDGVHRLRGSALNTASGGMANDAGEIDPVALLLNYPRRIVFGFPYLYDPKATGWLVWDKEPGFKGRSLTSPVEMASTTHWRGFRAIRLLWSGYMKHPDAEDRCGHPTQKPLGLMRELVTLFTDPGETILDPFAGSGTTLLAAKQLGRKAIGCEISEAYCKVAVERLTIGIKAARRIDLGQGALL